ncbi:MAG: hypothetical protein ACRC37_02315, partial [Lentisphaeria bacterium]
MPLQISWGKRAFFAAIILVITNKFHLLHFIGGGMFFAPDVPIFLHIIMAWLYAWAFLLFFLLLIVDLTQLIIATPFF